MIIDIDVAIETRDGTTLRANIYRPEQQGSARLPVIFNYTAYGKDGAIDMATFPPQSGIDESRMTPDYQFESTDCQWWCPRGYVCATVDVRGSFKSDGDKSYYSRDVGLDGYDVVEWLGAQEWSNGKVGMYGASGFAMVQWLVAAERPPALAAIMPFDGMTDLYREMAHKGGIPETQFTMVYPHLFNWGKGLVEDSQAVAEQHPFFDEYWQSKIPRLDNIVCPAYVACSWGDHGIHTRGTLHGWRTLSSKDKYLEIHPYQKWEYAMTEESLKRQLAFFDTYLAGKDTEVRYWPKVRFAMRERFYVSEWRYTSSFPFPNTEYTRFYPHPSGGLSSLAQPEAHSMSYDAREGAAVFELPMLQSFEFAGYAKLRLWVEAQGNDNMDLFITLRKVDAAGNEVCFPWLTINDNGPIAFGFLRASRRELDSTKSTEYRPYHSHSRDLLLQPGEIVPLDIEILPTSCRFRPGDRLQVHICGHDYKEYPPFIPVSRHTNTVNKGTHVIHFGGNYDSHLILPVIPPVPGSILRNPTTVKLVMAGKRVKGWPDEKFIQEYQVVHADMTRQAAQFDPLLLGYRQVLAVPKPMHTYFGKDAGDWDCISQLSWSSMTALSSHLKAPEYQAHAGKHVFTEPQTLGSVCQAVGEIMLDPVTYEKRKPGFMVFAYLSKQTAGIREQVPEKDLEERLATVAKAAAGTDLLRYVINRDISPSDPTDFFRGTPFMQGRWGETGATEQYWFANAAAASTFFADGDRKEALVELPTSLSGESSLFIAGKESVVFSKRRNF